MGVDGQPQDWIFDVRCPAIKGLSRDAVILLHRTMVDMMLMRLSIEAAHIHIDRSHRAVWESCKLLAQLRVQGF